MNKAKTVPLWEMFIPQKKWLDMQRGHRAAEYRGWIRAVTALAGGYTVIPATRFGTWMNDETSEIISEEIKVLQVAASGDAMEQVAKATKDAFLEFSIAYVMVSPEFRKTYWDALAREQNKLEA